MFERVREKKGSKSAKNSGGIRTGLCGNLGKARKKLLLQKRCEVTGGFDWVTVQQRLEIRWLLRDGKAHGQRREGIDWQKLSQRPRFLDTRQIRSR